VEVAYGENGSFVYKHFTNQASTACSNAVFGGDPAPGIAKKCLISGPTSAPPYGYSLCSGENADCNFGGTLKVAYGANGDFIFRVFTNGTVCNNTAFGEDPIPGTVKACYIPTDPPGYALCSNENGTCSFTGTAPVAYGASGRFILKGFSNGTACNNTTFGEDPTPGIVKACYIPSGPAGFTFCSSENGTCHFGAAAFGGVVYYGFDGAFTVKSFSGTAVACNNATFGQDPVPGIVKACFVQPVFAE
jgi:hypothetical protein